MKPKPINKPKLTGEVYIGLIDTFSHQIATGKVAYKQAITDKVVKNIKIEMVKEEYTTFAPFMEKVASAKDELNLDPKNKEKAQILSAATKLLKKAMSKRVEENSRVRQYITDSATLYSIRDELKEFVKPPVFDMDPLPQDIRNDLIATIKSVIIRLENLEKDGFDYEVVQRTIRDIVQAIETRL